MGTQCKTGAYVGVCHLCRISFHRVGADLTLSMKGWVAQYSLIRECCFTILCTPEWWQEKTPMKQEQGMPGPSSEFTTDVKPVSYAPILWPGRWRGPEWSSSEMEVVWQLHSAADTGPQAQWSWWLLEQVTLRLAGCFRYTWPF